MEVEKVISGKQSLSLSKATLKRFQIYGLWKSFPYKKL